VLGNDGGFFLGGKDVASLHFGFVLCNELPIFGDGVFIVDHFSVFDADLAHVRVFFRLLDVDHAADLSDDCFTLRHFTRFEDFLHARETRGNVGCTAGRHTTGMEGAERQLCTRLTDGLGSDDTNCRTKFHHFTASKVDAIAFGTDAVSQFTGHGRAEFHFGNTGTCDLARQVVRDDIIVFSQHFARLRVEDAFRCKAAVHAACHGLSCHIVRLADPDAFVRAAVIFVDDDVLCNVHKAAGQVTGIRSTQSRIRKTLAGAVCGNEVFLRSQTFAEVGADRHRDDAPGGVSHQTAHTCQLGDGGETTLGRAGGRHGGKLPSGSMCFFTASPTLSVVSCQIWISRSFFSCSVSRPRRKSRRTTSTAFKASSMMPLRSGGMEYPKPPA
jgi:hypothetical protein